MEKMPVATTNTISITGKKTHQLLVAHSVNGRGMPDTMKNGIKILVMAKNRTEIHKKIVQTGSRP